MKFKYIFSLVAGVVAMTSCSDDITTPVLELQQAAKLNAITPAEVTFTQANSTENFPEISWEKANYGNGAVVNYEVTVTNNTTQKKVVIGETGDNKLNLTNAEMNALLAKVGAYPGQTYDFTVSLASEAFNVYNDHAQNTVTFKATPYDPNTVNIDWNYAYVAVGYPEWDYTKAYLIGDPDGDGVYKGWVQLEEGESFAILDGKDITKVLAQDQPITDANKGFVEITLDDQGNVSMTQPTKWGLIGDATSGGWSSDTPLEYDADTRLWTAVTVLSDKEFKFRANKDWVINYGSDGVTTDGLKADGDNFKGLNPHAYIVTLNLTNAGKYTYTLEETTVELSSAMMTLPGSYQADGGWKPEADDALKLTSENRDFKYIGTHYFPANTEFKMYDAGTWLGIKGDMVWNETHTKANFVIDSGDNIKIADGGYYRIEADTKKKIASITKTGWEVIGDATPDGWDKGQVMTYNPTTKKWSITVVMKDGTFKFRWDAAWTKNLGGTASALTQDGANISITAGTYLIELDPDNNVATVTQQ